MKATNTINNTNNHHINRVAEENLKMVILAAAKKSEPSAKQLAKDQKKCELETKRSGWKTTMTYPLWDWYKKLMNDLEITEEYYTGHGSSEINIVESIFRLAEVEENLLSDGFKRYDSRYKECIKLISDAGLRDEFYAWKLERQVYDRNGQIVRVGDIIRFPDITEVCGSPVKNGYEAKVEMTDEGLVWIAYPENAWVGFGRDTTEHLHIPGVPFTAELAKAAEVVIRWEEGFIRHPYHGDFMFPRVHVPGSGEYQIFVKKAACNTK